MKMIIAGAITLIVCILITRRVILEDETFKGISAVFYIAPVALLGFGIRQLGKEKKWGSPF